MSGGRSRPSSPGFAMQGQMGAMGSFASPQANGFLSADYNGSMMNNMGALNLSQFGIGAGGHDFMNEQIDRGRSPRGRRGSSKPPEDPTDPSLLQDIPSWLRSLRLHKYTDNLKDLKWQELVELDDEGLEKRGVNALGARRKMLKVWITNQNVSTSTNAFTRSLSKSKKQKTAASCDRFVASRLLSGSLD
jgi:hypothetical protein